MVTNKMEEVSLSLCITDRYKLQNHLRYHVIDISFGLFLERRPVQECHNYINYSSFCVVNKVSDTESMIIKEVIT